MIKIGLIHVLCLCCVALLKKCNMQRPVGLLAVSGIEAFGIMLSRSIKCCHISVTMCAGHVKGCVSAYLHG